MQFVFTPLKSGSSAVDTGTWSLIESRQMMKPQAWIPVPRTVPSSILAILMVLDRALSLEASASRNSCTYLRALGRLIFAPSGSRSGMALQRALEIARGTFSTRATSLMEFFVAIVAYVMIWAQFSWPYLSSTHFRTRPRPSSSKSVSISGSEIRSGLRKRSNSKSYFRGSIFVMPKQ